MYNVNTWTIHNAVSLHELFDFMKPHLNCACNGTSKSISMMAYTDVNVCTVKTQSIEMPLFRLSDARYTDWVIYVSIL
jgi:hypothetical protein